MAATRKTTGPEETEASQHLFKVDFNDILTNGKMIGREVREFERVQPTKYSNLSKIFKSGEVPWDTILGMIYILRRRQDPEFSFDDLLDLTEDQYEVVGITVEDVDDEANPTAEPAGEDPTGS